MNNEKIKIPAAMEIPTALKFVRSNLLDVLREYDIQRAGIRVTEPNAQQFNVPRIQIEGVIQEAFASSSVEGYYVGQISSISARLGIQRADFKKYISGELEYEVEGWGDLSAHEREALLCAIGAAND
ncbi:hypothetical protein [Citrifermentans bremense]|uniref:hypothetical protein n=1 Tax=Citrifermentans bremense TaxID=60035 RepID=UPI0018D72061|nr:hypothetical protein [Citrifermentans bremense]